MIIDVKVPQLSESVAEATLVSWHKKAGEGVTRDENLIDRSLIPGGHALGPGLGPLPSA